MQPTKPTNLRLRIRSISAFSEEMVTASTKAWSRSKASTSCFETQTLLTALAIAFWSTNPTHVSTRTSPEFTNSRWVFTIDKVSKTSSTHRWLLSVKVFLLWSTFNTGPNSARSGKALCLGNMERISMNLLYVVTNSQHLLKITLYIRTDCEALHWHIEAFTSLLSTQTKTKMEYCFALVVWCYVHESCFLM